MFKKRNDWLLLLCALATVLAGQNVSAGVISPPIVDIPHQQFTLSNGLRVVVHTDRKAPVVSVAVWYDVGSKNEPAGRSGFAHLFEHLMFNGSENAPGEFFTPFKAVGTTGQNGTTNVDRTNYYQTVPTTALDMALWMESDRMGHLLGAIDKKLLDEQRGVVQNEKREGQNKPYSQVWEVLAKTMYPPGHPYRHTTIGSMNDLNAASLKDVKSWFRTWYGPNNAVLVLTGDIDLATAKKKAALYFGDIQASPTVAPPKVDVAVLSRESRSTLQDDVPQTQVLRVWNVAAKADPDVDRLQLLASVLGGDKNSRLSVRLLHQEKLVTGTSASVSQGVLGSQFTMSAGVIPGRSAEAVERAMDEELKRLLREGPTAEELARVRTSTMASYVRALESIGIKSSILASCAVEQDDPGCFRKGLEVFQNSSAEEIMLTGQRWLTKPSHTLVVSPGERRPLEEEPAAIPPPMTMSAPDIRFTTTPGVDRRTGVPPVTSFPELTFPALQRARLANGTTLILAERHDVPVVQMSYQFQGGYSTDPKNQLGLASFAMSLLDEGAGDLSALQFSQQADLLGAEFSAKATLDGSSAHMSAIKGQLDPSLGMYATMLRRPRFDEEAIVRVRSAWLTGIAQERVQANDMVERVLPQLVFGQDHPYGVPAGGSGMETAIQALRAQDLRGYVDQWLRPENATLVVVGDTTLAEIVPLLNRHLGDWSGSRSAQASHQVPKGPMRSQPRVFLIDKPGAVQARIVAAQLIPSTKDKGTVTLDMANAVLGGDFTSRLNMNLREDKSWAYGASSGAGGAVGERTWTASASVQIDRTAESMREILNEITTLSNGSRPAQPEELDRMKAIQIRSLPGAYESAGAVMNAIAGIVRYDRPDDYVLKRKAEVEGLTLQQVQAAAGTLNPNALTWVVVGDLKQIEAPVRALNLGKVSVIDVDGKTLR